MHEKGLLAQDCKYFHIFFGISFLLLIFISDCPFPIFGVSSIYCFLGVKPASHTIYKGMFLRFS